MKRILFFCFLIQAFILNANTNALTASAIQKAKDSLLNSGFKDVYENPDKAIQIGQSIFDNTKSNIKLKIRSLILISTAYSSKRDYQKALEYSQMANELSANINDPILKIEIISKTGILYQQLKIFDKSIDFLDKAEEMCLAYPQKDSIQHILATNYIVKGFIYKDKLNCDIALLFFDKGIKGFEKTNVANKQSSISIAHYNKGNCYILLSDYDAAKESFKASMEVAKKIKANSLLAFAQKGFAEVLTLEGKYTEAITMLKDAYTVAIGVGDLILNRTIYQGLSENYLALNDWNNYKIYYNLYLQTQTKVKESERKSIGKSINEMINVKNEALKKTITIYNDKINLLILSALVVILIFILMERKSQKTIKKLKTSIISLQKLKQGTL